MITVLITHKPCQSKGNDKECPQDNKTVLQNSAEIAIFSPGLFFVLCCNCRSYMEVWGLEVWVWALDWVFGGGISVDGVWGLWCGGFWVFWIKGSLYIHRRINLGKNFALRLIDVL